MRNKRTLFSTLLGLFFLVCTAVASANLYFMDNNFVTSGHVQGLFFPTHNEFDPNPSIPFPQRVVARYGLDVNATIASTRFLPKLFAFIDTLSLFGDSRPQISYNYSAKPIVMILVAGLGYHVTKHFIVGMESARHIDMGGYVLGEPLVWSAVTAEVTW